MALESEMFTTDNGWGFVTALLLIALYSLPLQFWRRLTWSRSSNLQQKQIGLSGMADSHAIRKVTVPLPHPLTDTTEITEESEFSEMTEDNYEISEVYPDVTPAAPKQVKPKKQVVFVGDSMPPLAGIPETQCPALSSSLKLKEKLLRKGMMCNRSIASGSSSSSSRGTGTCSHRRHKSHGTDEFLKTLPHGALKRYSSVDSPATMQRVRRDALLLNRLSRETKDAI